MVKDRCPGVLTVHEAADGGLARVRVVGGLLSGQQLEVLRVAAGELGDGKLELTSRGNVQVRGLKADGPRELSERLYDAGLLPSITHERVRNILASPLSGLDEQSRYDVLPVAAELDRELCARPGLAELPGRFLFALDDGRGDLAGVQADVAVRALDGREAVLYVGGREARVSWADAAQLMVSAAEVFLAEREQAWRVAELDDGGDRILGRLGLETWSAGEADRGAVDAGEAGRGAVAGGEAGPSGVPTGPHLQVDGRTALVVTVPLGSLGAEQAEVLQHVSSGEIRLTPWRSVVLPGLENDLTERLEEVGLVTKADSPWNGVTACAGQPGCAKALADVRADARRVTPRLPRHQRPMHWSGCERRCGKPAGEFVDVLALGNGYVIDGEGLQ
ncbi:precorrin-3B synthase [Kribbella antiqua]|uniref:Precorrin-3B synthase n=2 Tax=Kribbella antiqua TaxID=2512217 RepID=A0A4R2IIE4_9ACTN|nr:precorrin-3B synthase [Kribbella antiqua]